MENQCWIIFLLAAIKNSVASLSLACVYEDLKKVKRKNHEISGFALSVIILYNQRCITVWNENSHEISLHSGKSRNNFLILCFPHPAEWIFVQCYKMYNICYLGIYNFNGQFFSARHYRYVINLAAKIISKFFNFSIKIVFCWWKLLLLFFCFDSFYLKAFFLFSSYYINFYFFLCCYKIRYILCKQIYGTE